MSLYDYKVNRVRVTYELSSLMEVEEACTLTQADQYLLGHNNGPERLNGTPKVPSTRAEMGRFTTSYVAFVAKTWSSFVDPFLGGQSLVSRVGAGGEASSSPPFFSTPRGPHTPRQCLSASRM